MRADLQSKLELSWKGRVLGHFTSAELAELHATILRHLPPRIPRPEEVMTVVSAFYGFSRKELASQSRPARLMTARHAAMALIMECCGSITYDQTAELFGQRDQGAVRYAVHQMANRAACEPRFRAEMELLRQRIHSRVSFPMPPSRKGTRCAGSQISG